MNLGIAIALASEGFKNKVDKGGKPYILHCLHVMDAVSEKNKIPAVLHDYVEDLYPNAFSKGFEFLSRQGFSHEDLLVIQLLTHNPTEDYLGTYIKKIATDSRATEIKLADLDHNSQLARMKGLTKKDFDRVEKYHTAYTYLSKI